MKLLARWVQYGQDMKQVNDFLRDRPSVTPRRPGLGVVPSCPLLDPAALAGYIWDRGAPGRSVGTRPKE